MFLILRTTCSLSNQHPGQQFWDTFAFNPLPTSTTSVIDWHAFAKAIDSVSTFMSPSQHELATQVISDLEFSADTLINLLKVPLKVIPNKHMPIESAISYADLLATIIWQGHVCGPFKNRTSSNSVQILFLSLSATENCD